VMSFEKWKATTKFRPTALVTALAQSLGRMRFGA
jgi:ubiquinone biosynthesis protein COQ9